MNCASNIITANFSGGKTHATTARVYQWSRGIELCITGADDLPQTFKAHFSVQKRGGVATTIVGIDERVDVPNVLFTIGKDIHVWLGASETEDDAEILYTVDIPVAPAPMPEYYDAEDTGVFDAVVEQVSGYAATATAAANNAGASASAAAASATAAAASADGASASAASAATNASRAEVARSEAESAQISASAAAATATDKATEASGYASSASQSATDAAASKADAVNAAMAAGQAASAAGNSAGTAITKASEAAASASDAAQSATAAAGSANTAQTAAQTATAKAAEASASATAAEAAKTAAQTAQTAAETAATNAGQSASTATTKAAEAAQSASGAAQSKTDAEAAATRAEQAAASLTVDDALSDTSTNPVQNKVIDAEVTQLKSAIDALKIVDTASGAIASFPDGAAMPMEALSVEMEPIQNLNGQDAPYPAGGGKNLFDPSAATVGVNWNGNALAYSIASDYIPVTAEASYAFSVSDMPKFTSLTVAFLDSSKTYITSKTNQNFTTPSDCAYVRLSIRCASDQSWTDADLSAAKIQLELGSTATAYAPYENICPISGRSAVTVCRGGVNLWNEEWESGTIGSGNGKDVTNVNSIRMKGYIPVHPGETYYPYCGAFGASTNMQARFYDIDKNYIGYINGLGRAVVWNSGGLNALIIPDNAYYFRFAMQATYGATYNNDISINYPVTDTSYHPGTVQSDTIQLGDTVYGGTLDVTTGVMTVNRVSVDMGTLAWNRTHSGISVEDGYIFYCTSLEFAHLPILCSMYPYVGMVNGNNQAYSQGDKTVSQLLNANRVYIRDDTYTTVDDLKTALSGQQLVYYLTTPLEIDLTPAQLSTLKGQNNVWSDADFVTVDYVADPKLYIARLTEPDADMVADANITSGKYFMVGNTLYLATANIASGAAITPGVNCTKTNLSAALNAINA